MNWEIRSLGSVADLCLGKMLDQKKNKGVPRPYLANINVRWGSFDLSELREMRFEDKELDRYSLRDGDIVMCEGGEPGRCAIWRGQLPGMMFQKALHRIRPYPSVDTGYLYYALLLKGRSGGMDSYFTGATIKHLPGEQLAKIEVFLPPLGTQRRIAGILGAYDNLIEVNRRRIAVLEEMARGLFTEWFTRLRFPGHDDVAIEDTPDGPLPAGWRVVPLNELCPYNRWGASQPAFG
jgi:type I restriction enzyme S subunit